MRSKTNKFTEEVQFEMEQFSIAIKSYALQEFERIAGIDDLNDQNGE